MKTTLHLLAQLCEEAAHDPWAPFEMLERIVGCTHCGAWFCSPAKAVPLPDQVKEGDPLLPPDDDGLVPPPAGHVWAVRRHCWRCLGHGPVLVAREGCQSPRGGERR